MKLVTGVFNRLHLPLVKQSAGVASIEFALLLPILLLLVMGSLEVGLVFYATSVLEGATVMAARTGKVDAVSSLSVVISEVNRLGGGLLDTSKINVTILGTQGGGELVTYVSTYDWEIYTPLVAEFIPSPHQIRASVPAILEPS